MMREGIYELEIFHARGNPVRQKFNIHGYNLLIDVARFDRGNNRLGFGHRFERRDFSLIAKDSAPAIDQALAYLREHSTLVADQVFLLAHPRICGYVFNPVSFFFYCNKGIHTATAVEVNNTFGEQKHFLLPASEKVAIERKDFYVSPFISPFSDFHMRIFAPADKLAIGIHTHSKKGVELVAEMRGNRRDLRLRNLMRLFLKYPFHTVRVIVLIHWYALKLFVRRVPFFPKAAADAAVLHNNLRSQS